MASDERRLVVPIPPCVRPLFYLCHACEIVWLRRISDLGHLPDRLDILRNPDIPIPPHVGLVLDGISDKLSVQVSEAIQFLLAIPRISRISLFLPSGDLSFSISSPNIQAFHDQDVPRSFLEHVAQDGALAPDAYRYDFERLPDLVIVYSRSSSLCQFFAWAMYLATFILAGPIANVLPASIFEGILQSSNTEQRFGK
jgi:hypothetical protein